jgi:hypothetical protein
MHFPSSSIFVIANCEYGSVALLGLTSLQKESIEVQTVLADGLPLLQPKPNRIVVSDSHVEQPYKRQNSLNSKNERDLTLPLFSDCLRRHHLILLHCRLLLT